MQPNLTIVLRPLPAGEGSQRSWRVRGISQGVVLLSLISIWQTSLPLSLKFTLAPLVVAYSVYAFKTRTKIISLSLHDPQKSEWEIEFTSGKRTVGKLITPVYSSAFLSILRFKTRGKQLSIVITKFQIPDPLYRQLCVYCRYFACK